MSQLATIDARESSLVRSFERRPVGDRILAIVFFVAVFAAEVAIVQFAAPRQPAAPDGQIVLLPIT